MDYRSQGVFKNIGASNHSIEDREKHDYYSTDELAVRLLDKHDLLDNEYSYWETACGGGRLSKELIRLGYDVAYSSDKYDRGYGDVGVDFFECKEVFHGNTLTNPPYSYINDWIVHSLKITSNRVYIFGRIQTIETLKRYQIFKSNPPLYICPFVKRVLCYKNDNTSKNSSAVCYAWFIWDNTIDNEDTKVKWVNLIELKFSLICEIDELCVDDVGEDICHDMMCMYSNGEDVYEWLYRGYEYYKGES